MQLDEKPPKKKTGQSSAGRTAKITLTAGNDEDEKLLYRMMKLFLLGIADRKTIVGAITKVIEDAEKAIPQPPVATG